MGTYHFFSLQRVGGLRGFFIGGRGGTGLTFLSLDSSLDSLPLLERSMSSHRSGSCLILSESVGYFGIVASRAFFITFLPFLPCSCRVMLDRRGGIGRLGRIESSN